MKGKYILSVMIMLAMTTTGCYYDVQEELYPAALSACDTIPSAYTAKIQGLINNSCAVAGCHVANAQSPNLSDYTNLKNNIDRVNVRALQEKSMPPTGPLNDCDSKALQEWIDGGALNN